MIEFIMEKIVLPFGVVFLALVILALPFAFWGMAKQHGGLSSRRLQRMGVPRDV